MQKIDPKNHEDKILLGGVFFFTFRNAKVRLNNGKVETDLGNRVDRLLVRFSYLVDSHEEIILDDKVFNFLNYELQRTIQNEVIRRYLFDLMNFSQNVGTMFPYQLLVEYGRKHGFLDVAFFNTELGMNKYGKILNW